MQTIVSLFQRISTEGKQTVQARTRRGGKVWICLGVLLTILCAAEPAHAATITVNSNIQVVSPGASGNGDGLCQLSEAIRAANTDLAVDGCAAGSGADVIMIPAGTYTLSAVDDPQSGGNGLPAVTSPITLQGAGAPTTIIERSTAVGTPDFRLLFVALSSSSGSVILNDLTFRNGRTTTLFQARGGAIRQGGNTGTDLTVNRCVFDNNTVLDLSDNNSSGGAISGTFSIPLVVTDSTFTNNSASSGGGAIDGFTSVTNSTFINNTASAGAINGSGGALRGSSVTVSNSTFLNNSVNGSTAFGGGAIIVLSGGTSTITRNVFMGNAQNSPNGTGGALLILGGVNPLPTNITENLFQNNTSANTAGAVAAAFANAIVSGNTFQGNRSTLNGGALNAGAPSIITNSTFTGNTAGTPSIPMSVFGGAIVSFGGVTYNNITVTGNTAANVGAGGPGGGILFGNNDVIRNSIVAGNTGLAPDCFIPSGSVVTSGGHNIIGLDGLCSFPAGTGDQVGVPFGQINPRLGALANNGTTVMAGSNVGGQTPVAIQTHALLTGSPALGGGDPGIADGVSPHCAATDQRGNSRPQPGGGVCDVGAFEDPTGLGVTPNADLSVTKIGNPGSVTAGQNVTFTITVTNNGPDLAPATLVDVLPASFNFVTMGAPAGWTCSGTVNCTHTGIASGASSAITLTITATAGGAISNTATVSTTANDPVPGNNSATATTTVTGGGGGTTADLALTKSGPAAIALGSGNISYALQVSNAGPASATNVTLTDTLPAGVTFVSVTPAGPMCTQAAGVVTCNLGTLISTGSATVTIVVTPTANGTLTNTASVTATETDSNVANNSATAVTTVNSTADLSITKTDAPDPVNVGANLTYTVTVSNAGPSMATSVTLTDNLAANTTFVSATPSQGACPAPVGGVLTCNLGAINNGANATVAIVITPQAAAAGTITNTASVTAAELDPTTPNTASASTTVNAVADLSVTKTDAPDPVTQNSNITYTVTISNAGPSAATSVTATDAVPANVAFVSATGSQGTCAFAGGTVTCNVGTINSGANATATVVVTATAVGTVTNTISVSSAVTDPNMANNSATATTTVNPAATAADYTVSASPSLITVSPGQTATFMLTITPIGGSFNSAIALSGFTTPPLGSLTFSSMSVTPGNGPATVMFSVAVPSGGAAPWRIPPPARHVPVLLLLTALAMFTVPLMRRGSGKLARRYAVGLALVALLGLSVLQSACTTPGGGLRGAYTATVTATSGSLSHTTNVTINVD